MLSSLIETNKINLWHVTDRDMQYFTSHTACHHQLGTCTNLVRQADAIAVRYSAKYSQFVKVHVLCMTVQIEEEYGHEILSMSGSLFKCCCFNGSCVINIFQ